MTGYRPTDDAAGYPLTGGHGRDVLENVLLDDAEGSSRLSMKLTEMLWVLSRNRWLAGAVVVIGLALSIVATVLSTPLYRATASVQINQQMPTILEGADVEPAVAMSDANRFIEGQRRVLTSRTLARRVVDELGLARTTAFAKTMGARRVDGGSSKAALEARREQAIDLMLANLDAKLPISSRVADISFDSPDPALAARVANRYADSFISMSLETKVGASDYARDFLADQLEESRRRLEESQQKLIDYSRAEGVIDSSQSGGGSAETAEAPPSLSASNLIALNTAYTEARTRRVLAEQEWRGMAGASARSLPQALANPTIQALQQLRAERKAALDDLSQRYIATYPAVRQAAAQVTDLDRSINAQLSEIRASINHSYTVARDQEAALASAVANAQQLALADQGKRIQYNILKNEVDSNRSFRNTLLQRSREIGAAAALTLNNISIIDRAEVPVRSIYPKPLQNPAIGLALSFALAVVLILGREAFQDVIRTPEDVRAKLGLPVIGIVPLATKGMDVLPQLKMPKSPLTEAYNAARTSLEFATATGLPRSLLLISTLPGEGKTTSAIAIARSMAAVGQNVLLVDGDMRVPSLHRVLDLDNAVGLSSILTNQSAIQGAVQGSELLGFDILTSGPIPPNPVQLLSGEALTQAMTEFAAYDNVVIDGVPVSGFADALLYANTVDGVVFLVESGRAKTAQIKATLRRIMSVGVTPIGVLLTKFDPRHAGYSYAYDSYYHKNEPATIDANREAA